MQTRTQSLTIACALAAGLTAFAVGLRTTSYTAALEPASGLAGPISSESAALPAASTAVSGPLERADLAASAAREGLRGASADPSPAARSVSSLGAASREELRTIVTTSADVAEVHAAAYQLANRMELADADVDALLGRLETLGPEAYGARRTILWALSLRTDRVPVDQFGEIAARDPIPEVRRAALRTLGCVASPEAMAVLESSAFGDRDAANRGEAVSLLGFDTAASDPLGLALRGLAVESDADVRARWLAYVGMQRPAGYVALLEGFQSAPNESEPVRRLAAELLDVARQG